MGGFKMEGFLKEDKEFKLWWLMNRTRDAMFKVRARELRKSDISVRQAGALLVIKVLGDRAILADVARWLFKEQHSVCGLISRMEKDGLVKRFKDLEKKNLVRVEMTEKGRQACEDSLKRDAIHHVISALSEEERKQFGSCLMKLRSKALEDLSVDTSVIDNLPPWP